MRLADDNRISDGSESIHVAIAGPVLTEPLAKFLDVDPDRLPRGQGGMPVWQLVSDLVEHGQRVSVVTLDSSVSRPLGGGGPLLDLVYGPYRTRHRMRDLMRLERHAVCAGVLRTRPDLVHAHWCCEYALGALASGIPSLITVHDWMPTILRLMEARYWPYWSGSALLYFATLVRARHLTAVSPYIAEKVRHFSKAAVEVVPNGVIDGDFLAPSGPYSGDQPQPVGRPVIVTVNNGFSRLKNVQALLEAYRALRHRGVACDLHLVGHGYEHDGPCAEWARQRRLAEGVSFVGPRARADVLRMMRQATLLAHPSREESFGNTLIEAMSQRVVVIGGARSGAVPWVLGGGKAGLLVDVDNPRALADSMEAVLTQEALRKRLSRDAHAYAWRNFRQSQVTYLYLDAYHRLLSDEIRL